MQNFAALGTSMFSNCFSIQTIVFLTLSFSHCIECYAKTLQLWEYQCCPIETSFYIQTIVFLTLCVPQVCDGKKEQIHLFLVPALLPQKHHAANLSYMQ